MRSDEGCCVADNLAGQAAVTAVIAADNRIVAVQVKIDDRGQVHVDAAGSLTVGKKGGMTIGFICAALFTQQPGRNRRLKAVLLLEAADPAAFLVHRYKKRCFGIALQGADQFPELFR